MISSVELDDAVSLSMTPSAQNSVMIPFSLTSSDKINVPENGIILPRFLTSPAPIVPIPTPMAALMKANTDYSSRLTILWACVGKYDI